MKPLQECLEMARGKAPQEFANLHPHPVLIGLGVLPGELQRNPAKASGTLYLNFSTDQAGGGSGPSEDPLLNQVFNVTKGPSPSPPERIEVGGTASSDINIPDHTISRNHAFFILEPAGGVRLVDGGSTNGTFVNGSRLTPRAPTQINSGDIVTFGRNSFTFYDALSFAKLLSVQAMMRPRGAPRRVPRGRPTAQLGGGRPAAPRRRATLGPGGETDRGAGVVDPFLGPPRAGRFSTPEDVRKAAATTDPRRAFPPMPPQGGQRPPDGRGDRQAPPPQGHRPAGPPQGAPPGRGYVSPSQGRPQAHPPASGSAPAQGRQPPPGYRPISGDDPTARIPVSQHAPTETIPVAQSRYAQTEGIPVQQAQWPSGPQGEPGIFTRALRALRAFFARLFRRG